MAKGDSIEQKSLRAVTRYAGYVHKKHYGVFLGFIKLWQL